MQQLSSAQFIGIHISQSPRRLRAKYTQCKNFVYVLGISPLQTKAEQIQADNEKRMKWNHEVDRAIASDVSEAEIGQIKREYITDRIKASVDTFGNQPELYGGIITTAIAVLSLLVSKVLRKAREISEKFTETRQEQTLPPEPTPLPKVQKLPEPQIPPKPEMSASADCIRFTRG